MHMPKKPVTAFPARRSKSKGLSTMVEAHRILQSQSTLNFIGNVEGNDIPQGTADVIVSPGFLGNIVLKTLEGISEVASDLARDAYARKLVWKLGLSMVSRELRALRKITDWKYYGGAPLLGFDQVVIKAHGRSNARAIRNALKVAHKAVQGDLASQVRGAISELKSMRERPR